MYRYSLDLIETVNSKVENGVRFSYIFLLVNAVVPRGRTQILQKSWMAQFHQHGSSGAQDATGGKSDYDFQRKARMLYSFLT